MTFELRSDVVDGLKALASAEGLSVEAYLERLVEKERHTSHANAAASLGSGMLMEDGLLVYRTGRPLPAYIIDDAIRVSREQRSRDILGEIF